jgi:hypothetical protein
MPGFDKNIARGRRISECGVIINSGELVSIQCSADIEKNKLNQQYPQHPPDNRTKVSFVFLFLHLLAVAF